MITFQFPGIPWIRMVPDAWCCGFISVALPSLKPDSAKAKQHPTSRLAAQQHKQNHDSQRIYALFLCTTLASATSSLEWEHRIITSVKFSPQKKTQLNHHLHAKGYHNQRSEAKKRSD
jgi:hypothetical protein